jgi:pyridoxamine 5'-phosphate oxidase
VTEAQQARLSEAYAALSQALKRRDDPFRCLMLANVDSSGQPLLRTVVMRAFDPDRRELSIHTDARSPKVQQLRADPRAAISGYDAERGLQVRLLGTVLVHHNDAVTAERWAALAPMSQAPYAESRAASTPLDAPFENASTLPTTDAMQNMAVLVFAFHGIEVLKLTHAGHARLRIDFTPAPRAQWLTP